MLEMGKIYKFSYLDEEFKGMLIYNYNHEDEAFPIGLLNLDTFTNVNWEILQKKNW